MRTRVVVLFLAAGMLLANIATAQAVNHANSSVVVYKNASGSFPLSSLMGELDPGLIDIGGKASAPYVILYGLHDDGTVVPGLGTIHVRLDVPFGIVNGVLDASGHDALFLPPGLLASTPVGTKFTLQALVADSLIPSGFRPSGATDVEIVESLSAPISVNPGTGSQIQARAPMTALVGNLISVGNLQFRITATTEFENFDLLSELSVGDFLAIEGFYTAQGTFDAEQISLEDAEPQSRLRGMVQATGPSGLVLLGVSVYVSSSTQFVNSAGQVSSMAQVIPGTIVEVRIPVEGMFPAATKATTDIPAENEPEPEDVPEEEIETESPPPSFCS